MFKRGISLTVILLLLLTTFAFVFAETSDDDKADELNQLNLIAGDDTGYNLEGQLKRSEAATFIVKLLGKEEQVLKNKVVYTNTNFPDVPAEEWYATFIGFCAREYIISGYPDGSFQPNTTLSEKAFLSMMLKSLGYTDVLWNDVNTKAYEVGLVRDVSYVEKTSDNNDFTRGDVVDIMHNSLKLEINGSNQTVIERLISEGAAQESIAESLNLLADDEKVTSILSVEADTEESLVVKLNEEIADITESQIMVYEKGDSSEILRVNSFELDGKVLTLETEKQPKGDKYIVEISAVVDEENNFIQKITKEFTSFIIKEITSDYFLISKVESVTDDRIDVYFTHPIKPNAALPQYYDLYDEDGDLIVEGDFDTISSEKLGGADNVVGIQFLKKSMIEGKTYTLKVSGDASSRYYAKLDGGTGDKFTFVSDDYQKTSFKVKSVNMVKDSVVRVTFTSDVDMTSATRKNNYFLKNDDKNISHGSPINIIATGTGDMENRQFDLVFGSSFIEEDTYELEIDDVKDIFGEREVSESTYDIYAYWDEFKIEINSIIAFNDLHIRAYLSENIDPTSIDTASIVVNSGSNNVEAKASFVADNTIDLFLETGDQLSDSEYEFKIQAGLEDAYGDSIGVVKADFNGEDYDAQDSFSIDSVKHVADDIVLVELDEPISKSANDEDNFVLKYTDDDDKTKTIAVDEVHFLDAYTIVVECDELSDNKEYKLYIVDARDFSNQYIIDDFYKKVTY